MIDAVLYVAATLANTLAAVILLTAAWPRPRILALSLAALAVTGFALLLWTFLILGGLRAGHLMELSPDAGRAIFRVILVALIAGPIRFVQLYLTGGFK